MADVTHILSQVESGDPAAAEQLLPLVDDELRKLAEVKLAQEKPGQTLHATALVHDAYIRLVDVAKAQHWDSRGPFRILRAFIAGLLLGIPALPADDVKTTGTYKRIRVAIDAVPAIDTHDHLRPFDQIAERDLTDRGRGMTLHSLWRGSYYTWINPLTPWQDGNSFDEWWTRSQGDFDDARATSFYRYLLPAFTDLYGVDFETITDEQARTLDQRIFDNYKDDRWLQDVITNRVDFAVPRRVDRSFVPTLRKYIAGIPIDNDGSKGQVWNFACQSDG